MKGITVFIFLSCILLSSNAIAEEVKANSITLTTREDIQDMKKFDAAVDNITAKIMSCMETGNSNEECQCDYLEDGNNYQTVLHQTLEKHPEWRDNVTYYEDENGIGHTSSFIGHQRQSQMIDKLPCNQEK